MRAAAITLLLLVLLPSCASRRPANLQVSAPLILEDQKLVSTFRECVGPIGPTRELPIAEQEFGLDDFAAYVPLSQAGIVLDGFDHWLLVRRSSGLVYIVQRGGIAGTQTVFGPFDAEEGCEVHPPTG